MRTQPRDVRTILLGALLALALVACGERDEPATDAGGGIDAGETVDSGTDAGGDETDDAGSDETDDAGSEETDAGSEETGDAGAEEPDAGAEDPDAGAEDPDAGTGPVCAPVGIGAACDAETGECQTGLRCYTGRAGDFCSVDRSPDCGGFLNARCPASAPYCLRPVGSSLGACATEEEAICICAVAGDKIAPGEGTEGCPGASER